MRHGSNAAVDRNALLAPSLILQPLARRLAHFNISERQVVAVEQLGHFASCGERLVLSATVVDSLGAKRLNACLELVEFGKVRTLVHGVLQPLLGALGTITLTPGIPNMGRLFHLKSPLEGLHGIKKICDSQICARGPAFTDGARALY